MWEYELEECSKCCKVITTKLRRCTEWSSPFKGPRDVWRGILKVEVVGTLTAEGPAQAGPRDTWVLTS